MGGSGIGSISLRTQRQQIFASHPRPPSCTPLASVALKSGAFHHNRVPNSSLRCLFCLLIVRWGTTANREIVSARARHPRAYLPLLVSPISRSPPPTSMVLNPVPLPRAPLHHRPSPPHRPAKGVDSHNLPHLRHVAIHIAHVTPTIVQKTPPYLPSSALNTTASTSKDTHDWRTVRVLQRRRELEAERSRVWRVRACWKRLSERGPTTTLTAPEDAEQSRSPCPVSKRGGGSLP